MTEALFQAAGSPAVLLSQVWILWAATTVAVGLLVALLEWANGRYRRAGGTSFIVGLCGQAAMGWPLSRLKVGDCGR